jgi:hypothetical protein
MVIPSAGRDVAKGRRVRIMTGSAESQRHNSEVSGIPGPSRSVVSDIRRFVLRRPTIPTLMDSRTDTVREDYEQRIRQRLELSVSEYAIMNIHKLGIAAPARYVFGELLDWQTVLRCWPGHLATLEPVEGDFKHLHVHLLGRKAPLFGLKYDLLGLNTVPLFVMNAIKVQRVPKPSDLDSPRYVLYECSGGYPVGLFCCYVRSSIDELGETEQSQIIMAVVFNFYGKKNWPEKHIVNVAWERIHNRVTANILNRFKQLCECKFRAEGATVNVINPRIGARSRQFGH